MTMPFFDDDDAGVGLLRHDERASEGEEHEQIRDDNDGDDA